MGKILMIYQVPDQWVQILSLVKEVWLTANKLDSKSQQLVAVNSWNFYGYLLLEFSVFIFDTLV